MGKPLWVQKGCEVLSARDCGCWESRKGMRGSKQTKGGNRALCLGGVDRATVRLLLAVGALHVNKRHRAEAKGRRKMRRR